MRAGEIGWCVLLAGLPFAHFISKFVGFEMDIWYAQGWWMHVMLLGLLGILIGSHTPKPSLPAHRALACWMVWSMGSVLWTFYLIISKQHQHPFPLLMAMAHVLILVMAYLCFVFLVRAQSFDRLLHCVRWTGVVVLAYTVIQLLQLDQFYRNLDNANKDLLVGTIGNPTHLAAYLVCLLPCYLQTNSWAWKGVALWNVVMVLLCRSTTGYLALGAVILWFSWHTPGKGLFGMSAVLVVLGILWIGFRDDWWRVINPEGRLEVWKTFWKIYAQQDHAKPMTGYGTGFVMQLSTTITDPSHLLYKWRHVHNEYFQVLIEQGVIGAVLMGWTLLEWGKRLCAIWNTPHALLCSSILLAFLISCLTSFPAHLWLIGSFALIAVGMIDVVYREERLACHS